MSKKPAKTEDLRPRLPWLTRVGTTNGQINQLGAMIRGAGALLVLVNPVAALVMWLCLVTLSRTRVKGWWLSLGGGIATAVALVTGWVAKYNTVWRELIAAAREAVELRDRSVFLGAFSDWPSWLLWQIPVGITLGVCLAGFVLSYRARYSGAWRRKAPVATDRAVTRATRSLDTSKKRRVATRPDDVEVLLGVEVATARPFTLKASGLRMHAVVGGPTGFGKSTTVQRLIDELVSTRTAREAGIGALVVDMKGDEGMSDFLSLSAKVAGRPFYYLTESASSSCTYNPIRHGDAAQVASKLIETEANAADGGFSEPHYRRLGERYLLLCARVLLDLVQREAQDTFDGTRRPWRRDLPDLVRLMVPGALAKQSDRLSAAVAGSLAVYLREMGENKKLVEDVYGIYTRFALMVDGPAGEILRERPGGLDVRQAILDGAVVSASFDAASDAATSRAIGNLLIQDVTHSLASLSPTGFGTREGRMVLVAVDEFSALGGSLLSNLYSRGRSAGAAVVLASQDVYSDLEAVSPEFRGQVLTNANVIVLHQQRGEAPDVWSNALGTREVWKETMQVTADTSLLGAQEAASGVGSLRQAHEFVVAPDTLRNLTRGEAIVFVGHPTKRIAQVKIALPQLSSRDLPEESAAAKTEDEPDVTSAEPQDSPTTTTSHEDKKPAQDKPATDPWSAAVAAAPAATDSLPRVSEPAGSVIATEHHDDARDSADAPVIEPED